MLKAVIIGVLCPYAFAAPSCTKNIAVADSRSLEYSFSVPSSESSGSNYKFSPAPVSLGGIDFIHNTWALDHTANAAEHSGMEVEARLALLKESGYYIDDELIIFYFEPLSAGGKSLEAFPDGAPPNAAFDSYSDAVTARSLDSFKITFTAD